MSLHWILKKNLFTKKLKLNTNDAEANVHCDSEVKELKGVILQQTRGNNTHQSPAEDLRAAKEEAQAQESLKVYINLFLFGFKSVCLINHLTQEL